MKNDGMFQRLISAGSPEFREKLENIRTDRTN